MTTTNDQVNTDDIDLAAYGVPPERDAEARAMLERHVKELDARRTEGMSPPGALKLTPLLEKRRLEWEIPDGVFKRAGGALFDRILISQIDPIAKTAELSKKMGNGLLWKPDKRRDSDMRSAPRGVLVGAGIGALDVLRAHGVALGHIVFFAKNTTYTIPCDEVGGVETRVSIARVGDFICSEDVAEQYFTGEIRVEVVETSDDQGVTHCQHFLVTKDGKRYNPVLPDPGDMI
jgi:hypothetical protein